ncbi:hypothetical protein ABW21_db0209354 [Orbilia brochopaga]|nr:hypothetical protein ABW21_db0209354 [Drechslerella brochopaga]
MPFISEPIADVRVRVEPPLVIPKPKKSLTRVHLATSPDAFGIPFFQDLTGNWETRIKLRPVLQTIKRFGEEALAQNQNLSSDIESFDDQGEDVIKETYDLFRQRLKTVQMQNSYRTLITAMMDATENYCSDDKRNRLWLFKWLLSQAMKNDARSAKRKAKKTGSPRPGHGKRVRTRALEATASETATGFALTGPAVPVLDRFASEVQEQPRKKRKHMTITECKSL